MNKKEIVEKKYDLRGADIRGANFRGADLRGVNLWGAKYNKNIIQITGSKHYFLCIGHHIWIGCEYGTIEYWKIMHEFIGKENNYSNEEIKEYYKYIKICDDLNGD